MWFRAVLGMTLFFDFPPKELRKYHFSENVQFQSLVPNEFPNSPCFMCVCVCFRSIVYRLFFVGPTKKKPRRPGVVGCPRIQDDDHLLRALEKVRMESFLGGNCWAFLFVWRFGDSR